MTPGVARPLAVTVLAATLALGAGCRARSDMPSAERAAEAASAPETVSPPLDLAGSWTVVGHHAPGISALSDADATAWHGRTLRLAADQATSAGTHCNEPGYATHSAATDHFLGHEFNLPPGSLTPLASLERITVLEVSCAGVPWAALGGRLIEIDADRALAPWDGVFFELERDRDLRASGTEPFWRIEIVRGKEMRFAQVAGAEVVTPAPVPRIDSESGTAVYHAVTEANDLRVEVAPAPCVDSMSGQPFAAIVTVTLDGQTYRGCGEHLP